MKVLIACEESQTECKAFRALGHEAYSCDIQEPSGGKPEWHILGDALEAIKGGTIVTMTFDTTLLAALDQEGDATPNIIGEPLAALTRSRG